MFVMWSCKKEKIKSKKEKVRTLRALSKSMHARLLVHFCLFTFAFFLSACRRDMQDQPKAIAYRESTFFKDGVSSRPPAEGTVPRGYLRADREFYFGKKSSYGHTGNSQPVMPLTGSSTSQAPSSGANLRHAAMYPDDVDTFPFPITKEALDRGQERYNIF